MNCDPCLSLDVCFKGLLRKEQHLVTKNVIVAFEAQGKGKLRNMTRTQCYSCKEYNHIASNCSKKFCNYWKQQRNLINECLHTLRILGSILFKLLFQFLACHTCIGPLRWVFIHQPSLYNIHPSWKVMLEFCVEKWLSDYASKDGCVYISQHVLFNELTFPYLEIFSATVVSTTCLPTSSDPLVVI